jgi:hypothetical protein
LLVAARVAGSVVMAPAGRATASAAVRVMGSPVADWVADWAATSLVAPMAVLEAARVTDSPVDSAAASQTAAVAAVALAEPLTALPAGSAEG